MEHNTVFKLGDLLSGQFSKSARTSRGKWKNLLTNAMLNFNTSLFGSRILLWAYIRSHRLLAAYVQFSTFSFDTLNSFVDKWALNESGELHSLRVWWILLRQFYSQEKFQHGANVNTFCGLYLTKKNSTEDVQDLWR